MKNNNRNTHTQNAVLNVNYKGNSHVDIKDESVCTERGKCDILTEEAGK